MKNRWEMSYQEIVKKEKTSNISAICIMSILAIVFIVAIVYIIKTTSINRF